jgi:hypothetical protein
VRCMINTDTALLHALTMPVTKNAVQHTPLVSSCLGRIWPATLPHLPPVEYTVRGVVLHASK